MAQRHWFLAFGSIGRLASDIADRVRPAVERESRAKRRRMLPDRNELRSIVAEAQRKHGIDRLGFFGRARLAVRVQNLLIARGVPVDDARDVALAIAAAFHSPRVLAGAA